MTREECIAFLTEKPHTAKITTVRPDGRPHAAAVWFYVEDGMLYFTTWHATVKAKNLRHNPNVSIVVDDEQPPFSFVQIEGTAQITESDPDMLNWSTRIAGRYMGDQAEAYGKRNAVEGEWLIRVPIDKIIGEKDLANW
ncbi:MAG: PPOX class F420-dependent oxidoreductase [Chloroflexia bacterium]